MYNMLDVDQKIVIIKSKTKLTWGWAPLWVDDEEANGLVTGLDEDEDEGDVTDVTNKKQTF